MRGPNKKRVIRLTIRNKDITTPVKMGTPIQIQDTPVTKKSHSFLLPRCSLNCAPIV